MSLALAIDSVSVQLGGATVLDRVSLDVRAGEWVGLIGPNGAGKSTLLRCVVGTVAPGQGRLTLGGREVGGIDRRERARMVAMVPQRPLIPLEMTVSEYVLLGRTPHLGGLAIEGRIDLEIVASSMARLDLAAMAGRRLGTLSGGELQRAILARALAQRAPILLLDEPTAALDLGHQQQVLEMVEEMRRVERLTVVSAVHDLTSAAQFCDRLVLLSGGSKIMEGTPAQVLTEQAIALYFGATVKVVPAGDGGLVVIPSRSGRGERAMPAS
jgi:iron complex transport system ATP-binding protein